MKQFENSTATLKEYPSFTIRYITIMKHDHAKASDGVSIAYRLLKGKPGDRCILIIHGLAEHSGRYLEVAQTLNQAGFHVVLLDLRGHGLSGGKRGYIQFFPDYLRDIHTIVLKVQNLLQTSDKLILLAHSMGALVAIRYAIQHPEKVESMLLSAPLLGIYKNPPAWQQALAKRISPIWPSMPLPSQIDAKLLTKDLNKVNEYKKDALIFKHITLRWFTEIQQTIEQTLKEPQALQVPFFLQLAGNEKIVNNEPALTWYQNTKVQSKKLKQYDNLYHELYHEIERPQVVADGVEWLRSVA